MAYVRVKRKPLISRSKDVDWEEARRIGKGEGGEYANEERRSDERTRRELCPNEVDLRPCTCFSNSDGDSTVDCSDVATSGEIWSVFNRATWPSSRLQQFFLSVNTKLKDLPDGAFGNISFASMDLTLTNLKTIAPSALLPSRDRLVQLAVVHSSLEEFPFALLPRMQRLRILHLSHNLLTSVPPLQSQSLQELRLLNNHILKVEESGWATPNLKVLDIGRNPLSRFPSGILNGLEKLEEFSCSECHLGPTLSRGLLDFRSRALRVVHLDGNNISRLEPGAITGLQPNTSVYLRGMENLALSEDSFRPMLEVLTVGNGVLILGRKLFGCDCDIAWLVADRTFLRSIDGGCSSGKELKDLESDSMKNCPRPCPYLCVGRTFMSLCTPGTAILSKVDDCRSNEVETESKERASGPSLPSNPDPKTERTPCSPTIGFCLSSRHSYYCAAENEWELTDLYWCSGDLLCCASKSAVEKRKMELLSNKKGPIVTDGSIGTTLSKPPWYRIAGFDLRVPRTPFLLHRFALLSTDAIQQLRKVNITILVLEMNKKNFTDEEGGTAKYVAKSYL
ncbi:unnamed protein product [Darwinula stevensoni]|uniref:Uncharacterized protein n=1 Tax=Darwinula stevensoni TaxID=69355 RepID=A0A7R9AB54_9CRUS|nr:unnamed protein product [Darwinula stevensoni]CAG0898887.1 unnamed protein product [Darwinula stevensoni]